MSDSTPVRDDFIREAKHGNWAWVDHTLRHELITAEDFRWAMTMAEVDENQAIHLLGAKYLAVSDHPFEDTEDRQHIELWQRAEPDVETKGQLTIALAKRAA